MAGTQAPGIWPHGQDHPCSVRKALRKVEQERHGRRRSDRRSSNPTFDAIRADKTTGAECAAGAANCAYYSHWRDWRTVGHETEEAMNWERQWPIKPDLLMEGGNWAVSGDDCDCPDDLGILTTFRDLTLRHFDIFRNTSVATAAAGHLAGKILATIPERWPESVRALMVHSAEWTPAMKQQFDEATSENQKSEATCERYISLI